METKKRRPVAWIIVAAVLVAGAVASTGVSVFTLGVLGDYRDCLAEQREVSESTLSTLQDYIAKQEEEANPETKEDYVKIAERYEIRPTTEISDAYKSGDTSALDDKQKETLDMAKASIAQMNITDGMSDFEKEKAVYDWMTSSLQQDRGALTVIPSSQADCDNPYGVLKYHNAVCVGYATTFRMFMQMLDIECMVEHNSERWHSWNLVRLEGDWYITDIYSDAGRGNYAHFNMTDDMLGRDQNWDREFFPAANSLKYNMAYRERARVDTVYDIAGALRAAMNDKKGSLMISFVQSITEKEAQIADEITNAVDNFLMGNSFTDMPYCLESHNWIQDPEDGSYIFCVYMAGYNTSGTESGLPEEEQTRIQDAVSQAFDDLYSGGAAIDSESVVELDSIVEVIR